MFTFAIKKGAGFSSAEAEPEDINSKMIALFIVFNSPINFLLHFVKRFLVGPGDPERPKNTMTSFHYKFIVVNGIANTYSLHF